MADNSRIRIIDSEGKVAKPNKSEESKIKGKDGLYENNVSSSDMSKSAIDILKAKSKLLLSSNETTSLNFDVNKAIEKITPNTDIYSEDIINSYGITSEEAEYAELAARLGIVYNIINNTNANDAELSSLVSDLRELNNIDENKMNALFKNAIYSGLKDTISDTLNKQSNTSYNNAGPFGNSDNKGYNSIDSSNDENDKNSKSNISNNGITVNSGNQYTSIIDNGVDSDLSVLDIIDYANKNEVSPIDAIDGIVNHTLVPLHIDSLNNFTKVDKWDLRAMPDAMSNMYDVYFRICDKDSDIDGKHLDPNVRGVSELFSSKLLSARIKSIEIPAYERMTTSISSWGSTIERPTDAINTPGQSSFVIRGDTRLLYVDFMNILSGTTMADYLSVGSELFGNVKDTGLSHTSAYVNVISNEIANLEKDYKYNVIKIKKAEQDELDRLRDRATEAYKKQFKSNVEKEEFTKAVNEKAKKENISVEQAEYEIMLLKEDSIIANLKKQAKELSENGVKNADNYWAAKKEMREKRQSINATIRNMEAEKKKRNKPFEDAIKKAANNVKKAKKEKNKAVVESVFREPQGIPKINDYNAEATAYVTSAIARNISLRCCSAPFDSIEDLSNHKRIDIIVKRVSPGKTFKSTLTPKKDERFIFEDVKLIGSSTPITFNREAADVEDFTYNFIYKRFYKLDYYADNIEDWVKSQIDNIALALSLKADDLIVKGEKAIIDAANLAKSKVFS